MYGASLVAQTVKRLPTMRMPGFDPWVGKIPWRRKWQPTPVLLPGKAHGLRILVGYSPWGRKESDTTGPLHFTCALHGFYCAVHTRTCQEWASQSCKKVLLPRPQYLPANYEGFLLYCRLLKTSVFLSKQSQQTDELHHWGRKMRSRFSQTWCSYKNRAEKGKNCRGKRCKVFTEKYLLSLGAGT